MQRFWGTLLFELDKANTVHQIWCAVLLGYMLVLAILHHRWRNDSYRLARWKRLCLIPMPVMLVHYGIYIAGAPDFMRNYTPLYLIAVLALVPMLCGDLEKSYRIFAPITGVLMLAFGLHFCASSVNLHNFSRKSYTASFHALVTELDRRYVLKEWKELDFAALEAEYMPLVQKAQEEQNPAAFADTVLMFCCELHDGHVMVSADFDEKRFPSVFTYYDYGLALVQLDSGEVIAVCTDASVHGYGIGDGTVVTGWNGKPVLQAAAEDVPDEGVPVKENADRIALLDLSATGGETAEVTFVSEAGEEQTVFLPRLAQEHTLEDFSALIHAGSERERMAANFSTRMLDDKCGYLALTAETSGNAMRDTQREYLGESAWARELFRSRLRSLREQGMEYLVIDLRGNLGGYDGVGAALCGLLTDENQTGAGLGIRRDGRYIRVSGKQIQADGEFADLKAVALTNLECISAGDVTAQYLGRLPNVTLAGITDPNGSGQMTGGCCVLSKGIVAVSFPVGLNLDEQDQPLIDTRADQVSRDPVEVRIPLDYDAAMRMFRDREDYELEWAVRYLEDADE